MREDHRRRLQTLDHLKRLADPVELDRRLARIAKLPAGAGRQEGKGTLSQAMLHAFELHGHFAVNDEDRRLGPCVRFRPVAAAAGLHLNDILRKSFGKTRHRPGDDPGPGAGPVRQHTCHDIGHDGFGDDRISGLEHRLARQKFRLSRQTAHIRIISLHFSHSILQRIRRGFLGPRRGLSK
ncbi:hypothetical protein D3C72_1506580 [compost metagenome]